MNNLNNLDSLRKIENLIFYTYTRFLEQSFFRSQIYSVELDYYSESIERKTSH